MATMRVGLLAVALLIAGCSDPQAGLPQEEEQLGDGVDDLQATDQTGVIRGVVVTVAVVPIAGVVVEGVGKEAVTNEVGGFGFDGVEPGVHFLSLSKPGFKSTQVSVTVVAGVDKPDIVRVVLDAEPSTAPYVVPDQLAGYLACGAPIFATSVGCTTWGPIADATNSDAIFPRDWEVLPWHVQGELFWENTQLLGGQFIFELSPSNWPSTPQPGWGHREVTPSPGLAYLNKTHIESEMSGEDVSDWMLEYGMNYRIFAGPMDGCDDIWGYGCGLTIDQSMELYLHDFYNFSPEDGWRFTEHGDPIVPS